MEKQKPKQVIAGESQQQRHSENSDRGTIPPWKRGLLPSGDNREHIPRSPAAATPQEDLGTRGKQPSLPHSEQEHRVDAVIGQDSESVLRPRRLSSMAQLTETAKSGSDGRRTQTLEEGRPPTLIRLLGTQQQFPYLGKVGMSNLSLRHRVAPPLILPPGGTNPLGKRKDREEE